MRETKAEITQENPGPIPSIQYAGAWEQKERSLNSAAVLGLLGIGVLYFSLQTILMLIGIVASRLSVSEAEASGNFLERLAATQELYAAPILFAVVVSQYLCMLLPSWWLVKRWHTPNVKEYLRIRKVPLVEIVLAVLTTVAIIPTGTYIANLLTELLDIPDILLEINAKLFTAHSFPEFLLLVFVIAVTPAICERSEEHTSEL